MCVPMLTNQFMLFVFGIAFSFVTADGKHVYPRMGMKVKINANGRKYDSSRYPFDIFAHKYDLDLVFPIYNSWCCRLSIRLSDIYEHIKCRSKRMYVLIMANELILLENPTHSLSPPLDYHALMTPPKYLQIMGIKGKNK